MDKGTNDGLPSTMVWRWQHIIYLYANGKWGYYAQTETEFICGHAFLL